MGGIWELMIGIVRLILDSMLLCVKKTKNFTHEVLCRLMTKVCAIVSSRPIVSVSSNSESPLILTPAVLLTQKTDKVIETFDNLDTEDLYKAQWKQVQTLAENLWKRWRNEYLQALQPSRKWQNECSNIRREMLFYLKTNKWRETIGQQG